MSLRRKVAINASALAVGRLATSVVGIVSVGIAARYLGVEQYGAFVTATAFATIFGSLTDLGIWTIGARELAKRPEEEGRVLGGILTVGFLLALGAAVLSLLAMFVVFPGAENEPIRRAILIMTLVGLPFSAPVATVGAYFIAHQRAWVGMVASVLASAGTVLLLVTVAEAGLGFNGVVAAYAVNGLIFAAAMAVFAPRGLRLRPSFEVAWLRQLLAWALPLGGTLILSSIYWKIDVVLLSVIGSKSDAALYGIAFKVIDGLTVLPGYVLITLLPELARLADHRDALGRLVQKAFGLLLLAAAPLMVFFIAFADEVMELVGGSRYSGSAPLIRILMVGVLFTFLAAVFNQALIALNRQKVLFWTLLGLLPANVVMNVALIPLLGPEGASIAFVATEIAGFLIFAGAYARHAPLRAPEGAGPILVAAGAAGLVVGLALRLEGVSNLGPIVVLAVGGAATLGVFLGVLVALRAFPPELRFLLGPLGGHVRERAAA